MKQLKASLKDKGLFFKLMVFAAIMIVSSGIFLTLFAVVFADSMQQTATLKGMQVVQTVALFLLPCVIAAYLFADDPVEYLSLSKAPSWKSVVAVVFTVIVFEPAINMIGHFNEQMGLPEALAPLEQLFKEMEERAQAITERFMQASSPAVFVVNLIVIAILPAFSEELCFRGTLQRMFSERGSRVVAIWVCAILFSAVHFQFYGFLPRMLMGAFFGYMLVWSGSLWLPVTAHLTKNALVVILYYVFEQKKMSTDLLDIFGTGPTLWLGITSLVLVVPAVWLCRKLSSAS